MSKIKKCCCLAVLSLVPLVSVASDENHSENEQIKTVDSQAVAEVYTESRLAKRFDYEKEAESNPFYLIPHRMNYLLPVTATNGIDDSAYEGTELENNLNDVEAKLQISFKVPIGKESIFMEHDRVYLGFTMKSWWQVYNGTISKPFRESNYQPEIFYIAPTRIPVPKIGGNLNFTIGLNHESNGQTTELSRSWNRVMGSIIYSKNDFSMAITPWYRIGEHKTADGEEKAPDDDDYPDILDYYGHFELGIVQKIDDINLSLIGRQNFRTGKGYAELGMTFPLSGKVRGYIQYTNGYGESLINYNHSQQRIGVGIALTDLF